jgi:mannan endo-1,4-beta-mannosidase
MPAHSARPGRCIATSLAVALVLAGCGSGTGGGSSGGGGGGSSGGGGGGTGGSSKYLYKDGVLDPALTAALWTACGTNNPNLTASFASQTAASFDLSCSTTAWQLAGVLTDWNPSFDLAGYDTLAFDIGAATSAGMSSVKVYLDNNTVALPALTAGQLNHVVVPLSQLGSPTSFNQLGWYYQSTGAGPKLYVNHVLLTGTLTVDPPAAFAVDVSKAPTSRASSPLQISPHIYGINPYDGDIDRATKWGLFRSGGDSFTTWNWIANYHNTGNDYCFGAYGGGDVAGDVAWVGTAATKGIAALLTTSIVDYVAANEKNEAYPACNFAPGTNVNDIHFAPSSWFVNNVQKKPASAGALCLYPSPAGQTGSCALDPHAATVYQDELVNYLKHWFVDVAGATLFVELDNEPNYWEGTHPEIWSRSNVSYDDIVNRDKAAATAYRAVWSGAKIFGPVVAQDGIVYAHDYTRSDEFLDYYLPKMSGLLDALDVHYYNTGSNTATCLQSPRGFWDPTYTVPNNQDGMDYIVDNGNTAWAHRQVIPRLLDKVAAAGMSPVPGLAITEYDAGCEADIAGGIAQADTLGIFGKYGVYAATAWLNDRPTVSGGGPDLTRDYAGVAFDLFRNYDEDGAVVGDLAVQAAAPSVTDASLYAFAHSSDPSKLELVALNKTTKSQAAHVTVATSFGFTQATLYHLIQASNGANVAVHAIGGAARTVSCASGICALDLVLEPMSGTTIVLR